MPVAKGDRVVLTHGGKAYQGHVLKVSAAGVGLVLDDWRVLKPMPAASVAPSAAPVAEGTPGFRKWGKGDRIEFEHDGRTLHATVRSADLLTVKATGDGAKYEYTLPAREVRPSTKVLPKPAPSVMDDWSVRSYRAAPALSQETDAFAADIAYKGKTVIKASNAGHGGCNIYHGDRAMVDRLHADAKAWLNEANVEHLTEAADEWVTWHATLRPYAVDAREHLQEQDNVLGQYVHMPASP